MTSALREQIDKCIFGLEPNPLIHINSIRPLVHWYNTRQMNKHINRELENSYTKNHGDSDKNRSFLDEIDKIFKNFAANQMKLLLFARHDIKSSSEVRILVMVFRAVLRRQRLVTVQIRTETLPEKRTALHCIALYAALCLSASDKKNYRWLIATHVNGVTMFLGRNCQLRTYYNWLLTQNKNS